MRKNIGVVEGAKWLDINTAPQDGTLVHLLVRFTENSMDDAELAVTIGANTRDLDDLNIEDWQFAGWDWCQDQFTEGRGEVIGWWPITVPAIPS